MKSRVIARHFELFRTALLTGMLLCLPLLATTTSAAMPGDTDQTLQLKAGDKDFMAIFRPANRPVARGLVILLHDEDQSPDYPAVVSTLRRQLADDGWHTLSLSMPDPPQHLGEPDYSAYLDLALLRIQGAMDYVATQPKIHNVYLIGHGLGAAAGLAYLNREQGYPPVIKGFVGVSMGHFAAETQDPRLDVSNNIARLHLYMLDVYAQGDRLEADRFAKSRRDAARRNPDIHYRQLMLPARDHQFSNSEALLSKRVYGWLESVEGRLPAAPPPAPAPKTAPDQQPPASNMAPAPMMTPPAGGQTAPQGQQPGMIDQAPATVPSEVAPAPTDPAAPTTPTAPGATPPTAPQTPEANPPGQTAPKEDAKARENLF